MMEALINIPFILDPIDLVKRVHLRSSSYEASEFAQLIKCAQEIGKPKALFSEAFVEVINKDTVALDGIRFTSQMLRNNLVNVDRVFPYIVTCGREMDQLTEIRGNLLAQFWWDTIKEALLQAAHQHLLSILESRYMLRKIASMNPGSGDVDVWPIEQQRPLFSLLGDVRSQIGVELTDSFLMVPNKTVSGIHFPTERDFRTCQVCHREKCPNRSAPFDPMLWRSLNLAEENL